jgi:hypothetical protein
VRSLLGVYPSFLKAIPRLLVSSLLLWRLYFFRWAVCGMRRKPTALRNALGNVDFKPSSATLAGGLAEETAQPYSAASLLPKVS